MRAGLIGVIMKNEEGFLIIFAERSRLEAPRHAPRRRQHSGHSSVRRVDRCTAQLALFALGEESRAIPRLVDACPDGLDRSEQQRFAAATDRS
jgi:hypothetical protein